MKRHSLFKTKVLYILGAFFFIWGIQTVFSHSSGFRDFYLTRFYPGLSAIMRMLTGWFPFSIGDILYVLAAAWFLIGLFHFIKNLLFIRTRPFAWLKTILRFVFILLVVYALFLIFWGLNYRYDRLQADFDISRPDYSYAALQKLCDTLIQRTNSLHDELAGNDTAATHFTASYATIKQQAIANYKRMAAVNKVFRYNHGSIKPSMFGYLMNYTGVTGYYNPFTGEAQVNTTPPKVELPFTTCHEMAHQLGFAAEDDANFISYLVTSSSPNMYFRYSAHFSLLLYAMNALAVQFPEQADSLWNNDLSLGVQKDYKNYFDFYKKFRTGFKPLTDQAYDQYLKANGQKRGIRSYRGVVALLLDYISKYNRLP